MVRPALGDEGEDVLLAAGEVRQGAVISPAPLYRAAGLQDTGVQVFADAHPPGHRRRMIVPDLVGTAARRRARARGLAVTATRRSLRADSMLVRPV